jgi:hypothetical protein
VPAIAPTPSTPGQTGSLAPVQPSAAPSATSSTSTTSATDAATTTAPTGWDRFLALPWGWILGALLLLVAVLTPWVSTALLVRRRWTRVVDTPSSAEAAWAELDDRVHDLGVSWPPSTTPRQRASSLSEFTGSGSVAAGQLTRLRAAVESARFGSGSTAGGGGVLVEQRTDRQAGRLVRADVDAVVASVAAGRPRWVRWRARYFPMAGVRRLLDWWDRD